MDRREIEEIESFLNQVGQPSLLAYYGLQADAPDPEKEAAIKKRRAWAQGQQANPKYKTEAMFLIKNNGLVRRLLLEDFDSYRATFMVSEVPEKLDELMAFLSATIGDDLVLTPQGEAATRLRGRQLGLSENALEQRITEGLSRLGARRRPPSETSDLPGSAKAIDFYEVLRAPPTASTQDLELAYRARYRWARNLTDLKRSSEFLSQLDEAWRVLQSPERRARYDELRREAIEITDEVERAAAEAMRARMRDLEMGEEEEAPPPFEMSMPAAAPSPPPPVPTPAADSPPAPQIAGRTLGLADGPQTLRERAPRLSVAGALQVNLEIGNRPHQHKLLVQNLGQGRMFGRVSSDVPWLQPQPTQLQPNVREQFIVVNVRPSEMPRRSARGTVTVVADHGERRVVTFDVTHGPGPLRYAIFAFLFVGAAASVVIGGQMLLPKRSATPAAPPVTLEVAPRADHVYVDDVEVGQGTRIVLPVPAPDTSLKVRVETAGFTPSSQVIAVAREAQTARIVLGLEDPLSWRPGEEARPAEPPPGSVATLQALGPELSRCLPPGTPTSTLQATVWIKPDGKVGGLDLGTPGFDAGALACMRGVYWLADLEPPTGDYAQVVVSTTVGGT